MANLWDNLLKTADNAVKESGKLVDSAISGSGTLVDNIAKEGGNLVESTNKFVGGLGDNIKDLSNKSEQSSQEIMMSTLNWAYEQTLNGVPGQKTVDELVNDYLSKYDKETAIDKLIQVQMIKAATSGFVTGFGGLLTMPVTIPANIASVLLVQMRMIAAIAKIRGYDLKDDQVRTYVYVALTGTTVSDIAKKAGIVIGNKLVNGMIKKIPGKLLTKINQAVGFRLVTKFGTTGAINLGKMIPIAGALVGGTIDTIITKAIADGAKTSFTEFGYNLGDGQIVDKEVIVTENQVKEGIE